MQKERFDELEGLRGVAAVMVAIYHFLLAFYLFSFFGPQGGAVQHMRFEDNLYGSPFTFLLSGSFAVAIFFVLSGFVLSFAFFKTKKTEVIKKLAAKRYLRLMIPALASTILCFLIIALGAPKILETGAITQSQWLLDNWQFTPTFFDALKSGMVDIFTIGSSPFNNVLWTMAIEFAGSFIIFGFLVLFGQTRNRWIGYGFLLLATFNTWFMAFVIGMIFADMYANKLIIARKRRILPIVTGLLVVMYAGSYPVKNADGTVLYGFLTSLSSEVNWNIVLLTTGAAVLFLLVLLARQVARVFSLKPLTKLGKYTFSLYLVHVPVIYTVGLSMFLYAYNNLGFSYNVAVLLAFVASSIVTAGITILFNKYIDEPAIKVSSLFAKKLLSEKPILSFKTPMYYYRKIRKSFRRSPEASMSDAE